MFDMVQLIQHNQLYGWSHAGVLNSSLTLVEGHAMVSMKTLKSRDETESAKPIPKSANAKRLESELTQSGYAELRSIEVSCEASVITICGIVQTFYVKQLAQEIAKRTYPDAVVDNRITVVSVNRHQ